MLVKTHLTDYLRGHATTSPDKKAIVFENSALTWGELWQLVEPTSQVIADRLDSHTQQVVSLLLTNSPQFVITYLAILHSGHIAMPLDPAYKKLELDAITKQVPPALIVTDDRYRPQITTDSAETLMVDNLINTESKRKLTKPLRLRADKQIASLTFTSGTTGRPKAAPYTHANHIWNIQVCSEVWDWTTADTLLISLPLSHWYGLVMGLSGALYHGNTLYLQEQSFDAEKTLAALASGDISIFTHVPLAYAKILEAKEANYDISGVRLCISGGGPLPPPAWQEFKKRYNVEIVETYGSSETGRIAANTLGGRVIGSAGKILPSVEVKISSKREVLVRSLGIFPGYFHNPAATKKSLDKDGWWKTGDLGELNKGYLYLKGRKMERIRKFGYSISPRDVEWALYQNPQIKEVQVMGLQKFNKLNDELVYFVVGKLTETELIDYCKENLIFAWRPDKIIFLDKLPRTSSGKPRLSLLREMI